MVGRVNVRVGAGGSERNESKVKERWNTTRNELIKRKRIKEGEMNRRKKKEVECM